MTVSAAQLQGSGKEESAQEIEALKRQRVPTSAKWYTCPPYARLRY